MKKIYLHVILLFTLVALQSGRLYATVYYVSPSGSDSNSGTSSVSAWQTIAQVNSINIQPGDSILFEGGQTLSGSIFLDMYDANDSTNMVTFSSYGVGKAIINSADSMGLYAYNTQGFSISNLIFEGSGMNTNTTDGIYLYADMDGNVNFTNVSFLNVEIRNYGGIGLEIGAWPYSDTSNTGFRNVLMDSVHVHDVLSSGIEMWGYFDYMHVGWSHKNVIIRNTLVNNVPGYTSGGWTGSGIVIAEVDSGLIEHCVAHDNGIGNTACGGPVGIWAWDANNVTIQYCESYRNSSGSGCDGGGFDFDGGETNSLMQYNYSHDNDGNGYLLGQFDYARPWYNNVVRYNISENDARTNGGAIDLFKGPGTTMTGAIIYQNTIYITPSANNTDVCAFGFVDWDYGIDSTKVYNNIFQTTGDVPVISMPDGYYAYFAGNLYWPSGDAFDIEYQNASYSDLSSFRIATGNEIVGTDSTGIVADPLLTNAGSGGVVYPGATTSLNAYMYPDNSPAVNAGLDLMTLFGINSGSHDYFNNTAPVGLPDIGAYESSFSTTVKANKSTNKIAIYPSPLRSGTDIQLVSAHAVSSIELLTITGVCTWKNENAGVNNQQNKYIIPTGNLASGIYFLRVTSNSESPLVRKLVIE